MRFFNLSGCFMRANMEEPLTVFSGVSQAIDLCTDIHFGIYSVSLSVET